MHYYGSIRLGDFYLLPYANSQENDLQPRVILRDKRTIAINESARLKGFRLAMAQQEAKCLAESHSWLIQWQEETYRSLQAEWLTIASLYTDHIESTDQHHAFLDLSTQSDPAQLLIDLAQELESKFSVHISIGLARAKWIAALAEEPISSGVNAFKEASRHAITNPAEFLAPKKIGCLTPVSSESLDQLRFLGYTTIGLAAEIPYSLAKEQFGKEARTLISAARGEWTDELIPNFAIREISDSDSMEGGSCNWLEIERVLKQLSQRMSQRLKRLDSIARTCCLLLEMEQGRSFSCERTFAKPLQSPLDILRSAAVQFPDVRFPIEKITIKLSGVAKCQQKQLSIHQTPNETRDETAVDHAIRSLRTVYGDESVKSAALLSVPRRKRLLRAWQEANGWR